MKHKIEDFLYYLTILFCSTVIFFGVVGLIFKFLIHISK